MLIRKLTPADLDAYHALRLRGLKERPDAFTSSYAEDSQKPASSLARRVAATNGEAAVFVIGAFGDDGDLIGVVGLEQKARAKERHKAVLYGMYVPEEHENQGIGHALMLACIAEARKVSGLEQVQLTVTSTNLPARHLYAKHGFLLMGTEKRAIRVDGKHFDKDHMVLHL